MSRRSVLLKLAAATAVVGAGVILRTWSGDESDQSQETLMIKVNCREVLDGLDKFIAGKMEDPQRIQAFQRHLDKCGYCMGKHDKLLNQADV